MYSKSQLRCERFGLLYWLQHADPGSLQQINVLVVNYKEHGY
jgi:hypothetical protein